MSKPHDKTLTMFYTEGNPVALLVTRSGRRHRRRSMPFPTAEAALAWCRRHKSTLIYLPTSDNPFLN